MEKEKMMQEYEVTLNSLVEKTKFIYSAEFYALDEFEKQKYNKDKMATEAHLGTLCNVLWGEKIPQFGGGLSDIFALSLISSMFNYGGGFGSPNVCIDALKKQLDEEAEKLPVAEDAKEAE